MKLNYFLTFLITLFSLNLLSQTNKKSDKNSDNHEHHKNEIGVANSPVYFINEKVFTYGLHFHYVRKILKSKFGIGLGYERLFDEHKHNTLGLVATYRPIESLNFNVSPGLTFEDNKSSTNFALHFETSYEFEIKNFHIGPVIEFAFDFDDYHFSLGIHIGYGF